MASTVHENLGGIDGQDGFGELIETSEINSSLVLRTLLDEFQMEEEEVEGIECDDERLMSVIQSLQAEIDPLLLEGHGSSEEINEWDDENSWTSATTSQISMGHIAHPMDDQDCSTSVADDLDDRHFNWMEMDDVSAASYMECRGEGIGHLQVGVISECSQMCYGVVPFEEQCYASLWQETYAPLV